MDEAWKLPNFAIAPDRKLLPEIFTGVPPSVGPRLGKTMAIMGLGSVEMFNEKLTEKVDTPESCTLAINEKGPFDEGMPAMVPVDEFRVRPLGRCPPVVVHE